MAACPNCGRATLRTKDWACQWCGYPLISRAFKLIDKTYKELQEERLQASMMVESDADSDDEENPETEEEFNEEPEPESEPEPEDKRKRKPEPKKKEQKEQKPKFRFFRPAQPTRREPAPEPLPPPVSRPVPRPEPPPPPVQRPAPPVYMPEPRRPEPRPEPPPRPVYTPAPQPAPKAETAPQPAPEPERPAAPPPPPPAAVTPPPPAPEPPRAKPEIVVEATAPYISSVKGEDIREGMEISADDLDALFKADKSGTNSKLNGKTIVLKGVVEKVFIREHLDIRYIVVTGKRKLSWSDRCTFNQEDASKAGRLNEGDDVAIRAKYDGYGKNIIFKDCQVV